MSDFDFIHTDYQHLRILLDDPTLPEDLSHIDDIDTFAQNAFAEILQKQMAELTYLQERHPEFSGDIIAYLDKGNPQNIDELLDRHQYLNKINANVANEVVKTLLVLSQAQEKFNVKLFKVDLTDCGITRFPISEIFKNVENLNVWMNLTSLDFSNNPELTNLDLRPFSKAETIIFLGNQSLKSINLSGLNKLKDLQIHHCPSLLAIEMEGVPQKIKQLFEEPISFMQRLSLIKKNFISSYLNWHPFSSLWSWSLSWFKTTQEEQQEKTDECPNPCFEDACQNDRDSETKSKEGIVECPLSDKTATFLPSYLPYEIKSENDGELQPIYIKIPVKKVAC